MPFEASSLNLHSEHRPPLPHVGMREAGHVIHLYQFLPPTVPPYRISYLIDLPNSFDIVIFRDGNAV